MWAWVCVHQQGYQCRHCQTEDVGAELSTNMHAHCIARCTACYVIGPDPGPLVFDPPRKTARGVHQGPRPLFFKERGQFSPSAEPHNTSAPSHTLPPPKSHTLPPPKSQATRHLIQRRHLVLPFISPTLPSTLSRAVGFRV
eukprot:349870-Chlamydomonas_euryale.AAC.1